MAADVWLWKESSKYSKSDDWIFASPHTEGRFPYWPDILLLRIIQPAARRAGIKKRVGWHTFRHYAGFRTIPGDRRADSSKPRYCCLWASLPSQPPGIVLVADS